MKKRFKYFGSTLRATLAAGALAISPVALLPASAEEEEREYTMEDQEDSGWFNRAVEAAGPAYREADEFQRDEGYYLENEEDMGWFDRAVTAAGPDYTDADEFE